MKMQTGTVITDIKDKTIIVSVVRQKAHSLYGKIIKRSKRYKVHCIDDKIKKGDQVRIVETKPISKYKHYKVMAKI